MMYPKPKSAPGRMVQSKLVKNRTNATKEIEAWARKTDDQGTSNASRMSGQLTDNVTEERMLRAKLWELSKERYKFLTQSAYEKKVFTDRMQRRSSALLRRASSAGAASTCGREATPSGISSAKRRWRNARVALMERLDPSKAKGDRDTRADVPTQEDGPEDSEKPEGEGGKRRGSARSGIIRTIPPATSITIRPISSSSGAGKIVLTPLPTSPPAAAREEGALSEKPPPSSRPSSSHPRNVKFDKASAARQPSAGVRSRSSPMMSPGRNPSRAARPPSASAASSAPNSATSQRSRPWASPAAQPFSAIAAASSASAFRRGAVGGRYGMRLESKTKDPRYSLLENSLSPLRKQRCHTDVSSIVSGFDALHVPPRRRKEAKPKIELKALEYIEEQGFAF